MTVSVLAHISAVTGDRSISIRSRFGRPCRFHEIRPYHPLSEDNGGSFISGVCSLVMGALSRGLQFGMLPETVVEQLPRLGKRELIYLLLFTCNYVVSVWRGFLFLWVLGMGYVILLWHSLSLSYNYFRLFYSKPGPKITMLIISRL